MTAHHARANDVAALCALVEPVRLKRHDALKILAHDEESRSLLVDAINTYAGVTTYAQALHVIETLPEYQLLRTLCATCGWSLAMLCPECSRGCGCETGCTGWRHRDYGGDSFDEEFDEGDGFGDDDEPEYGDDEDDHLYDDDYDKDPLGPIREEPEDDWSDEDYKPVDMTNEGGPRSEGPPF